MGMTPFLIVAIDNVMIIAMNAVLQKYGGPERGDALITCNAIVQSFMLALTMPLGGISAGTQSILSYNFGAKQIDRGFDAQIRVALFGEESAFLFAREHAAELAGAIEIAQRAPVAHVDHADGQPLGRERIGERLRLAPMDMGGVSFVDVRTN